MLSASDSSLHHSHSLLKKRDITLKPEYSDKKKPFNFSKQLLLNYDWLGWISVILTFFLSRDYSGLDSRLLTINPFFLLTILLFVAFTTQYLGICSESYREFRVVNVISSALSQTFIILGSSRLEVLLCIATFSCVHHLFSEHFNLGATSKHQVEKLLLSLSLFGFTLAFHLIKTHSFSSLFGISCSYAYLFLGALIKFVSTLKLQLSKIQQISLFLLPALICVLCQLNYLPNGNITLPVIPLSFLCILQVSAMSWQPFNRIYKRMNRTHVSFFVVFFLSALSLVVDTNNSNVLLRPCEFICALVLFGPEIEFDTNIFGNYKRLRFAYRFIESILEEKESRSIFYFFLLNATYMIVQIVYGFWSNSLGLITDAIHMMFDCIAVLVGLIATGLAKLPSSDMFPFGFAKIESLSGFTNGIFLLLISISIVLEAAFRLFSPPEMRTEQLLTVSIIGLLVNLVGLLSFSHGHAHSHGHGSCPHSHHKPHDFALPNTNKDACVQPFVRENSLDETEQEHEHEHDHEHDHDEHSDEDEHNHDHDLSHNHIHETHAIHNHCHSHSEHSHHQDSNMRGILLHIMADTMGSVGVIVSTILIKWFGWTGFDPIASILIAVLIFVSVLPLITSSAKNLILYADPGVEYSLKQCLSDLSVSHSIVSISNLKFWSASNGDVNGILHVQVGVDGDLSNVRDAVETKLRLAVPTLKQLFVQTERPNTCWCGK
ncbi:cation diffusion family zinc membrane transporter Cis4 [Schizosaccharomyces japonicus yFS275]|uniref:Zinc transporter n=1 Tax=Schizosaccharomyces japonicus (strain yFS275 / FY16936) TaxID=402676 RepID=B6JVC1_SCHJY|nr:cation diffusion family zinc membrane transporter Cis4 [Schizosaccharomyces japonicus yFS275]EEB05322.1 cation diffusion family zinc membrane transporter Cis4 [Schizosaccharomyces japonicus yFS275]